MIGQPVNDGVGQESRRWKLAVGVSFSIAAIIAVALITGGVARTGKLVFSEYFNGLKLKLSNACMP